MVLAKPQQPILDDGKHWDADKLERKKVADYLTPLVESITQPFVISLASDYGTGKTFFIRCWRKDLEAKGLSCVYFNAWETDFSQDPLFAFIAAMKRELGKIMGADTKLNEAAKIAGGLVAKRLAVIAGKAGLRAVLGADAARDALDLANINAEEIVEASAKYAEDRLRAQEAAEKSLLAFKAYLTATVLELVADKKGAHKKIIIFVDDLDRCRPDYAISVLECIKHLFSIQGLVFILSIDDRQLHQAVKAVYGPSIDSDGYLRRFIDWRFKLPKVKRREFIEFLFQKLEIEKLAVFQESRGFNDIGVLKRTFALFCDSLDFSLREVEQLATDMNLYLRLLKDNETVFDEVLAIVIALRSKHPVETEKFALGTSDAFDIIGLLPPSIEKSPLMQIYGTVSRFRVVVAAWFMNNAQADALGLSAQVILSRSPKHESAVAQLGEKGAKEMYERWKYLAQSCQLFNISIGQLVFERLEQVERFK
jgi:hypothetical protein